MTDDFPIREPEQIRQDCARKLRAVQVSDHFQAILGCLLGEDWTTPRLRGLVRVQVQERSNLIFAMETFEESTRPSPSRGLAALFWQFVLPPDLVGVEPERCPTPLASSCALLRM